MRVRLTNQGATAVTLALGLVPDAGTRAALARDRVTLPPGARREAEIDVAGAGADGLAAGRLVARGEGGARRADRAVRGPHRAARAAAAGPARRRARAAAA